MFNPAKLLEELQAAGIKTCGCNADGIVWGVDPDDNNISNEIQDRSDVKAVLSSHDRSPDASSIRDEKYNHAGISSEKMIHALWKKVMSADSTDADALQVLIDQVDLSIGQ